MKRNLLVGLVLVVLFWCATAVGASLPYARRWNGDPDEFQARQVLDEGITLGHAALDAAPGRGAAAGTDGSGKPMPSRQARADRPAGRARITVNLSGKHFFLEK